MSLPYLLTNTTWKSIRSTDYKVAILPWGATEAHNYHLPYGTDAIIAEKISAESARIANDMGGKIIVLPAIAYGVNTGQSDILLDMNLNPSTQLAILRDIITVLNRQGIHKLVILNTHGGNDFKQIIRELNLIFPEMFLCQCNSYKIKEAHEFVELEGEHADEFETSLMLFLTPELVLPLSEAGPGKAKTFSIPAFKQGWAWAEHKWSQVTEDTGIGDPSMATREKGEKIFNLTVKGISSFLLDLQNMGDTEIYL